MTDWPAWNSTQLYNPGNQVNYVGQVWQCLVTNTNSVPSQSNRNWNIVTTYPPYDAGTEYLPGDVVSYGGQLWVCQIANNNGTVGTIYPDSGAYVAASNENVWYWILLPVLYPVPTIYPGDNAQLPDSIISASEGAALTPAYRGLIYCVWELFPLINFADRIPSFRAEVTYTKAASSAPSSANVTIDTIYRDGGIVAAQLSAPLSGAAFGGTVVIDSVDNPTFNGSFTIQSIGTGPGIWVYTWNQAGVDTTFGAILGGNITLIP